MSKPAISGDGVFTHVFLGAADPERSKVFYDAVLAELGISCLGPLKEQAYVYGKANTPAFVIGKPVNGEAPSSNGVTVGFAAASKSQVDAFHEAGLESGGTCEGAPGPRDVLPGAYAAYLRDPSGNKICAYTFE